MPGPVMRNAVVVALSALLGGLIGGLVIYLVVQDALQPGRRPAGDPRQPSESVGPNSRRVTTSSPASRQAAQNSEWASLLASANSLVATGKLQEAQELYLTVLLVEPSHQAAMRGLVRVVRLISRGDKGALRRQAQEYRQAIAQGLETEEHYTAPAMELLARASLEAAGEAPPARPAERQPRAGTADASRTQSRAPRTATPPTPRARPPVKIPRESPPRPQTSTPPQTSRPAAPPSIPPVNVNEPFFVVAVGPIASGERASAIIAELTVAGFSARASRQDGGSYLITLGPYRESEAKRAAAYVKSRFGEALPVVLTPAR